MTFQLNPQLVSFTPEFEGEIDEVFVVFHCPTASCESVFNISLENLVEGPQKTVRSFCKDCGAVVDTTLTINSTKKLDGVGSEVNLRKTSPLALTNGIR